MKRNIIITFFALLSSVSFSQTEQQVAVSLRNEYSALSQQVDSLKKELNTCRGNYDSDPKKYGELIVSLESQLFEANKKQADLAKKVSSLPGGISGVQQQKTEYSSDAAYSGADLIDSPFFKANISSKDLAILKNSSSVYTLLAQSKKSILMMYDSLKMMKDKFDKTDSQQEVDETIIAAEKLKQSIQQADNAINDSWLQFYNCKVDNYLVMLDKLGNVSRSQLESLDLLARQAQSSVDPDETMAPSIADLKAQNQLILAYEEILAQKLGYTNALDKIHAKMKEADSIESTLLPNINFPYRSTCVYGNISLGNSYSYSTPEEIPEVKIPSKGVYYSVQLYMSQTPVKQLSTFKGAAPLMILKSGGYNKYLAGGFRTYSDASKNLSAMLRAGFKAPRIVAWLNGSVTSTDKAKAAESSSEGGFVVEVKSSKSSTSSLIKEVISIHAEGKNWTNTQEGGNSIFRIMTFGSKEEAGVIAQIIRTKDSSLEVNVVED